MPECEAVLIRAVPPGSGVPQVHHQRSTVRLFVFAGLVNGNRWSSNGIRSETPVNPSRIKLQDHPARGVFFLGDIRTADLHVVVYPYILWMRRKDT